mgnify:CR=1 FL=1
MFSFEKLDAWHQAMELTDQVYKVSAEFPREERFGLTSQIRRASVSIASNIAEGNGRTSAADHCRFVEIACGSVMEVVTQLHVAMRQSLVDRERSEQVLEHAERLARMLSGLKSSLQRDGGRDPQH